MLDKALDRLAIGVIIIDTDYNVIFTNKACEEILNLKREEGLHKNIDDLLASKSIYHGLLSGTLKNRKEATNEQVYYRWNNEARYLSVSTFLLEEGGEAVGALAEFTDVTEYVLKERELNRRIERLAINIVPVISKLGVLPLQPMMQEDFDYSILLEKVLNGCLTLGIEKLAIDLTSIGEVEDNFTQHLQRLTDTLRLIGVETVFTGVKPAVALAIVESEKLLADNRFYTKLSEAVEYFKETVV